MQHLVNDAALMSHPDANGIMSWLQLSTLTCQWDLMLSQLSPCLQTAFAELASEEQYSKTCHLQAILQTNTCADMGQSAYPLT